MSNIKDDVVNVYGKTEEHLIYINVSDVEFIGEQADIISQLNLLNFNHSYWIKDVLKNETSGEAANAVLLAFDELSKGYDDLIANFKEVKVMMDLYKDYLDNGPLNSLNRERNHDHLYINTSSLATENSELSDTINVHLPKVKDEIDEQEVGKSYSSLFNDLTATINAKRNAEPPLNADEEIARRSKLVANNSKYIELNSSIGEGLSLTDDIINKLDLVQQQFKNELENYDRIWHNFVVSENGVEHYSEQRVEEETIILDGIDFSNEESIEKLLSGLQGIDQELLKDEVQGLIEKIQNDMKNTVNEKIANGDEDAYDFSYLADDYQKYVGLRILSELLEDKDFEEMLEDGINIYFDMENKEITYKTQEGTYNPYMDADHAFMPDKDSHTIDWGSFVIWDKNAKGIENCNYDLDQEEIQMKKDLINGLLDFVPFSDILGDIKKGGNIIDTSGDIAKDAEKAKAMYEKAKQVDSIMSSIEGLSNADMNRLNQNMLEAFGGYYTGEDGQYNCEFDITTWLTIQAAKKPGNDGESILGDMFNDYNDDGVKDFYDYIDENNDFNMDQFMDDWEKNIGINTGGNTPFAEIEAIRYDILNDLKGIENE